MKSHFLKLTCVPVLLAGFALVPNVFGQNNPPADRYIVELNPGAQPAQVAAAHGLAPRHVYTRALNGFAAQVPAGRLAALANDPRVAHIAVDHPVFAIGKGGNGKPPPPPPPPPTGQVIPAGVARIGARLVCQRGMGIGVAIVDTGLDFDHLDLNISTVSFVSPDFSYTTSAQDDNGHGTHVGGIVAAIDNSIDVVGVAPSATLFAVKVLDNTGSGFDSDVTAGLDWVIAHAGTVNPPIRVINMSLGRDATTAAGDKLMHDAVINVVANNITVVVAAGNDSSKEVWQMVPAGFPEVIAIASTTAKAGTSNNKRYKPIAADTASFFTTDGKFDLITGIGVAISAPGEDQEDIAFPFINSLGILSTALGGGTTRLSGTSMAAPHAAGVVALFLQEYPTLDPVGVKALIMSGDKEGLAPLNSSTSSYSFDGDREGILYAPIVLAPCP